MSSAISSQLSEEQREFLTSLEEEFKNRYTEKDEEFSALMKQSLPPPPIVTNWSVPFWHRDDRSNRHRYERDRSRSPFRSHYRMDDRRQDRYYRDNGDRYSHSSRDDYRYSHSSRDDYRYSHSSRDDYNRYGQQNHAGSYRP